MPRRSGRLQMQRQDQLFVAQKHARKVRILNRKRKLSPEDCQEMSKEMFQFEIQNRWIPVSETVGFNRSALIPTPENGPSSPIDKPIDSFSSFRFKNIFPCPIKDRTSPLPDLNWADSDELWRNMLKREIHYVRDRSCLERHPLIDAKMRSILLDWLIEVCEVYHLHRETFFLAQDYVDRFLAASKDIPKMTLQLIGITSLFIASKLEEIYPPKLGDFAYVTDGACSERNILDQEIIMLQALKWNLSPVTVNNWLNVYMQLAHTDEIIEGEANFLFPKYSPTTFIQITQLLDLCILDVGSWHFPYSILAATALYHMSSDDGALCVTGLTYEDIAPCILWMEPFALTIKEQEKQVVLKKFRNVVVDDSHNIQTHSENLELLAKAQDKVKLENSSCRYSPVPMATVLTPPQSSKKKRKADIAEVKG
ncbi:G1/S-specific cyclin-E-like [Apostichopus japonicus]|uniref:G1/S-specific cyclin-E-like n=1 Tax=Stichopus japonicus TaxID=307972 RepID=UPI003AB65AFE